VLPLHGAMQGAARNEALTSVKNCVTSANGVRTREKGRLLEGVMAVLPIAADCVVNEFL